MVIKETFIKDLYVLEPRVFEDNRGYFFESYNQEALRKLGINYTFVQDNQVYSKQKGVVRGLHFQKPPFAQTKLIRCLQGAILDVAVDIRKKSATYGKSFSIVLSTENKKQLLVPQGFAHGYSVLTDIAEVFYKCDNFYEPQAEGGLAYNDKTINIDWQIAESDIIVAPRDATFPCLNDFITPF